MKKLAFTLALALAVLGGAAVMTGFAAPPALGLQ
jgi:hypothetical protein